MRGFHVLLAIFASAASFRVVKQRGSLGATCDSQWNNRACSGGECYTCGDRISYLRSQGLSEGAAKGQVAGEFPAECGACGGSATCDSQWDNNAGGYTCGARITYLKSQGLSDTAAKQQVANEFPSECGACGSGGGPSPTPPPAPSPGGRTIKIMSYNTEYIGYHDGRTGNFANHIRGLAPAIVGLQECQDRDGLASRAGYTPLRDTGGQNYIMFDTSKVSIVSGGSMSIPTDGHAPRAITWGHFKLGGVTIYFFNTHLPHNLNEATPKSTHARIARMLLQKRRDLGIDNEPTIVVGDMNSFASDNNNYPGGGFESNLEANGFVWAYRARGNPGYGGLDHILYSAAHWTHTGCRDAGTGSSDHPAITCDVTLRR